MGVGDVLCRRRGRADAKSRHALGEVIEHERTNRNDGSGAAQRSRRRRVLSRRRRGGEAVCGQLVERQAGACLGDPARAFAVFALLAGGRVVRVGAARV